jgi:ATP-dependent Lon protease
LRTALTLRLYLLNSGKPAMSDDLTTYRVWPGPLPLQTMMQPRWDVAFEFLYTRSLKEFEGVEAWLARTKASDDHAVIRAAINDVIETCFANKKVEVALAWSFLAADPKHPETIQSFLPQVAALLDKTVGDDDTYTDSEVATLRSTMFLWMDAAGGKFTEAKVSMFAIAARLTAESRGRCAFERLREQTAEEIDIEEAQRPGLVVMPRGKSSKLVSETSHWKDIVGKKLPFVMAKDVYQVQATLRREYPHAWSAIDLLTRELRDGKPVRLKPVILLGDPGSGKSRMVRRLAQLLQTSLYRFDASGIADAVAWAGTARGWGNTTPSIPARAVQQAMQANPMILIDEIEKGGSGHRNGNIYSAMTPFLERETAQRLRDISLDAEIDLSFVNYIATSNDDTAIPSHIRDRFRVVRVPLPTLDHLRPLAMNVMSDLAAEEDLDPRWMAPLDLDEEIVIAKAWQRAGMSIRKLQKIVSATLEARDAVAMRQ